MKSEYKLSRIKYRVNHLISYKCPSCGNEMGCGLTLGQPHQWWTCDECKKTFELCFKELVPK